MNSQLMVHFVIADEAQYLVKELFNQLKNRILKSEGEPAGYDIEEVRILCRKCNATGEIQFKKLGKKPETIECPHCKGSKFYKHEDRYYLRYKLNDLIFHIPVNKKPDGEPFRIIRDQMDKFGIDPKIAYRALLFLFAYYDETLLAKILEIAPPANEIWSKEKTTILEMIDKIKIAA